MSHDVSAFKWVRMGRCAVKARWMELARFSCNCKDGASITNLYREDLTVDPSDNGEDLMSKSRMPDTVYFMAMETLIVID